ncbi:MAG: hypothetical protein MUC82_00505 [Cypionkella sp.]|jgi:hypothetical protein|nr:hypothetical protein [Cypionkella sp.]
MTPTRDLATLWDDDLRAVLLSDGSAQPVQFFAGQHHVAAWQAMGYDVRAAAIRAAAFVESPNDPEDYIAQEVAIALGSGIATDDTYLWRIERFPRHMLGGPFIA